MARTHEEPFGSTSSKGSSDSLVVGWQLPGAIPSLVTLAIGNPTGRLQICNPTLVGSWRVARTDGLRANANAILVAALLNSVTASLHEKGEHLSRFPPAPNEMAHSHYARLLLMGVLSFTSMYALMYAMVDSLENVYPNLNQFYMAGLMTAPMMIIEVVLMGSIYESRRMNAVIVAVSTVALVLFWVLVRWQAAISDKQFLQSMIPHHGGAILMCEKSPIVDPAVKNLCKRILASQQAEISEMKDLLRKLEK